MRRRLKSRLWAYGPPACLCGLGQGLFLALAGIEHRRTQVAHTYTKGFVEWFHRTVKDEFFAVALRERFYEMVEAVQSDLDRWLVHYNTERPHLGYRNQGKTPLEFVSRYLENVKKEA